MDTAPVVVGFDLDMTLIDTAPGFGEVLRALGAELGVDFPVEEMTAKLGPPLDLLLEPYLARRGDRRRRGPVPRALPRPRDHVGHARASAARTRRSPRYARHGGRMVVVTGKYPDNARLHLDHLGLDVDHLEGWVWGVGKADVLRREGASDLRRRPRPRRRGRARRGGAERVGAHRWLHPRGAAGRRHPRRARRPRGVPRLARRAPARPAARRARRGPARARVAARRLQRGSRQRLPAGRRRPRAGAGAGRGRDRLLRTRSRRPSATRPATSPRPSASTCSRRRPTRWSARATAPTTRDRCYFCKAELVEVLAPLAAERGLAHVATGTNADDAVAGFRPGIRAAAERGAVTPLRDAGLTKAQVREASRRWEPADLGQARRGLPVVPGRVRRGGHPVPARPGRAGRGGRAGRAGRPAGCATCGSATWASGRRWRSTRPCCRWTRRSRRGCWPACATRASTAAVVDPRGFRSGSMNEAL